MSSRKSNSEQDDYQFSASSAVSIPKRFLKCPKLERLDVWSMLPGLRPRPSTVPSSVLASTAAPFESRSSAAATWPFSATQCSGVEPQALVPGNPSAAVGFRRTTAQRPMRWGDDERCGQLSSMPVQPTNEWWMFLDSTASNCAKQNIFTHKHKHSEQVSIHLVSTKCLQWNNLLLPIPTFFRVEHEKRGFLMVLAKNLVILEKTGFHFYDP